MGRLQLTDDATVKLRGVFIITRDAHMRPQCQRVAWKEEGGYSNNDIPAHTAHVVDGKWHQSRWLFFTDVTADLLLQYRNTVPHAATDHLWHGKRGALTSTGIYQVFRRIARKAGVSGHANPHAWRHAFGKHATISGMPTATLQQLLGHSSVETTQIYVALDTAELQNAHEQHTPVRDIVDQSNKA